MEITSIYWAQLGNFSLDDGYRVSMRDPAFL
jgi:hypothetical protein